MKRFDDVHFLIVGRADAGCDEDEISDRGLSGRIHLVGQRDDVSWLKRMQLFLLTSRVEGLPNVLIEAQGFGVPVVLPVPEVRRRLSRIMKRDVYLD